MKRLAIAALMAIATAASVPASAAKIEDPRGTAVTFTSTRTDTAIYVARGDAPTDVYPDPFERVGVAPITVHLAPGVYTVETSSESTSRGRERILVGTSPIAIDVHPGDVFPKTLGIVLEALGVISIGLGVVALVSISPHSTNYDRWAIGLPLLGGGAAAFAVGLGLNVLGSTRIVLPSASVQGLGVGVVGRF